MRQTLQELESRTIPEIFDHLLALISSRRFLNKQGLGNEVPFFICPYRPDQMVEMEQIRRHLAHQLDSRGIRVLEVDLYDLALELLRAREILEQVIDIEQSVSKGELLELLQGVLDAEAHVIPVIAAKMAEAPHDVLFVSGVGEVFPYLRSHNVLNNLQSVAKDQPTVLFFPGAYTHTLAGGASLDLFGRLHDDKYYRAFNIFHCEP